MRPTHPDLERLLADGRQRSATLSTVLEKLERTHWKIYIQFGRCPDSAIVACLLHLVGQMDGDPYLRIVVGRRDRHPNQITATMAHELQHAVEIVESVPPVTDSAGIAALYQRIGWVSVTRRNVITYETDAAAGVGDAVLRELASRGR